MQYQSTLSPHSSSLHRTDSILHLTKRLYKDYVSRYLSLLYALVALLILLAATTSVQPILLQQAFDKIFGDKDVTYLVILPLVIVVISAIQAIATYSSALLMNRFGSGLTADMRSTLFSHLLKSDLDLYANHGSGHLLSRVAGETIGISTGIQRFFSAWARDAITSLGLISVMFYQSFELTVISLCVLAVAYYPLSRITKRLKKLSVQLNETAITLNARLLESFEGIRVIKAFAKEESEADKIGGYILEIKTANNRLARISSLMPPLMQVLGGMAVAFVIWYGGYELIQGELSQGELIAFLTSLLMLTKPVKSLTSSGAIMISALVNAERFYSLLDTQPKSKMRGHGNPIHVTSGRVAFERVQYIYPNGTCALDSVSFTIAAGRTTAIVGHSGSGKSTVFNLLLKFCEPTMGTIRIDDQDISEASVASVRDSIAVVSQDVFIFDDTARNNIKYGRSGATEDEIVAAAKAARCHDFIMTLPNGYDTRLGFLGQTLSGGQKQRIAIARAFLRRAPILLLDEATSSLDPKTDLEIQDTLESLMAGRTTVIIAHRLSTVMKAYETIVLEQGSVVARGSHAELIGGCLAYRQLFGV